MQLSKPTLSQSYIKMTDKFIPEITESTHPNVTDFLNRIS